MTRVGVISQARMTSTRLPGKVLMRSGGRSMLAWHVGRLLEQDLSVIVATTVNQSDDPIAEEASALGIDCFRGDEHDVLGRYASAAREFALDVVVRVTSDCPLIDGALVRRGIESYTLQEDPHAYVSNVVQRTYPRGFDLEVFSSSELFAADMNARTQSDREHVTPYLRRKAATRNRLHALVRDAGDASRYRVTLDTIDDFELIRRLLEDHGAGDLGAEEIIGLLDSFPELSDINAHVEQKKISD